MKQMSLSQNVRSMLGSAKLGPTSGLTKMREAVRRLDSARAGLAVVPESTEDQLVAWRARMNIASVKMSQTNNKVRRNR